LQKDSIISNIVNMFPFINEMEQIKLDELLNRMNIAQYPKGTVLLEEGHTCQDIAFVLDGSIRVYKLSSDGKEVTLYRIGRGDTCVLIVSCLMGNNEYPAVAEVEEPVTLMTLPASYFKELFHNSPSWQEFVFRSISQRLTDVMMVVEQIAFKSMDKRLASFLYEKLDAADTKLVIEVTHEDIALELGTAREVVSRVLKDFEKKAIVELSRGKIYVKDKQSLKKIITM